jgi:DNA anti-recombination protein RmuC
MAVTAMKVKSSVDSVREMVQDFLVPELKAVKATMDGMRTEMQLRDEKQTQAIKHLDEKLTESIKHLDAKLADSIKHLDEKLTGSIEHIDEKLTDSTRQLSESIKQLSDKLDSSVEFRERLAALEAKSYRS